MFFPGDRAVRIFLKIMSIPSVIPAGRSHPISYLLNIRLMTSVETPEAGVYIMPRLTPNQLDSASNVMDSKYAYVTLLTKNSYLAGVLVLDLCLRMVNSKYPLVVMVTPSLPEEARAVIRKRQIKTREVKVLRPPEGKHTLAADDSRFADTWTKLRCFL